MTKEEWEDNLDDAEREVDFRQARVKALEDELADAEEALWEANRHRDQVFCEEYYDDE